VGRERGDRDEEREWEMGGGEKLKNIIKEFGLATMSIFRSYL
jgi:hypothetical protein